MHSRTTVTKKLRQNVKYASTKNFTTIKKNQCILPLSLYERRACEKKKKTQAKEITIHIQNEMKNDTTVTK